ncbi:flavodoxin family protein [Nocardia sp. 2]|uniref:Flavodoxin family protein n=1 Tax=Nocardia acididurans TaxID=2802282 RepID=A0ABS1M204_9NOCA|nr:flavodoxin family protein [Nocardia acididurans]MBL1074546.1 flavodoxin family protein [Nocardia acididurans]
MKTIIVCTSVSHGNTRRVADVMAEVLDADVVAPEQIDAATLADYDLVGFGSGIFLGSFHENLREFVRALPAGQRGRAFVYATSGFERPVRPFTGPLVTELERKGFEVAGSFSCRAWDTWLPFKPVGGIRKNRPNADDLTAARAFAAGLRVRSGIQ